MPSMRTPSSHATSSTATPRVIYTTADNHDQVIENEQREGLRLLELANTPS